MSGSPEESSPYQVVYSELCRERLRELGTKAVAARREAEFAEALRELDRRLRVYPQFGEPYSDLMHDVGQHYRGAVPPLVVWYTVFDDRRLVVVAQAPQFLPNSGFDVSPMKDP
jgi:hypothetical protein